MSSAAMAPTHRFTHTHTHSNTYGLPQSDKDLLMAVLVEEPLITQHLIKSMFRIKPLKGWADRREGADWRRDVRVGMGSREEGLVKMAAG